MTTKQLSRREEMLSHIANRKSSGLTVSAYCKEHGIGEALYYYWQKKFNAGQSESAFRQIALSDYHQPVSICYPNGVRIELGSVPEASLLKQLVCCI